MDQNKDKAKGEEELKRQKVTITLTCKNVKSIERVTNELIAKARTKDQVEIRGPLRMPIKHLVINCRKSPCGEGSKTWDRLEMKIYKRVIDFICNPQDIKEITSIKIDPGVEVELALQQD